MVEETAIRRSAYGTKFKLAIFCLLVNVGLAVGLIASRQFDVNNYGLVSHVKRVAMGQSSPHTVVDHIKMLANGAGTSKLHKDGVTNMKQYQNEDYSWPAIQPYMKWALPMEEFPPKIKELPEPSSAPRIAVVTSCELRELATNFPLHLESIMNSNSPPSQVIIVIGLVHDLEWELQKLGKMGAEAQPVIDYLRHFILRHQANSDLQEYRLLRNSIDIANSTYIPKDLTPLEIVTGLGLGNKLVERDFNEWSRLGRGLVQHYQGMSQTLEEMVTTLPADFKVIIKSEQRPWPGTNWFHGAWNAFEGPYRSRSEDIISFAHCGDILSPSRTEVTAEVLAEDNKAAAFVSGKRTFHPMKPTEIVLSKEESELGLGVVLLPQKWAEGSRESMLQNQFFDHRNEAYRAEMMEWQTNLKARSDKFGAVITKPWLDDKNVANAQCHYDSEFAWRLSMNEKSWTPTSKELPYKTNQLTDLYELYEGSLALRHRYIMFNLKFFGNTRYDADRRIIVHTMVNGGEIIFNRIPLTLVKDPNPDQPEWYNVNNNDKRYIPKKAYAVDRWFSETLGEEL